jgi:hypothetical protein
VLDFTSCSQLLLCRVGVGSKMVQHILTSVIIHTIWAIWIERNQRYFHNKQQAMSSLFNHILAEVKLSYNYCLVKGESAMLDYKIAKLFNILFKVKRITHVKDVVWSPPSDGIVKFNCDGSSIGGQPCGSIVIVIRDSNSYTSRI